MDMNSAPMADSSVTASVQLNFICIALLTTDNHEAASQKYINYMSNINTKKCGGPKGNLLRVQTFLLSAPYFLETCLFLCAKTPPVVKYSEPASVTHESLPKCSTNLK